MRAPEETADAASRRCASTRRAAPGSRFDEHARGSLAVGKLADLAVLSKDYLTVPVDEIGGIRLAAHHGRRPHRLRGRALRGASKRDSYFGYSVTTALPSSSLRPLA